jgi:hypothetical protein
VPPSEQSQPSTLAPPQTSSPRPPVPVPAPTQATSLKRVTRTRPPEPSRQSNDSTEYVGRHRAPGPIDADDDDEDDAATDALPSESGVRPPGAHRERRQGADSFRGVG